MENDIIGSYRFENERLFATEKNNHLQKEIFYKELPECNDYENIQDKWKWELYEISLYNQIISLENKLNLHI